MKRMNFKNKRSYYSIPIFAAVCATCSGVHVARANTVNQIINGGVDLSLDDPLNWSTGLISNSTNDVLIASPYPPAATNIRFSLGGSSNASGTVSYGSINDTDATGYYNYFEGSTLNSSSYTLNVGFGSNSVAPSSQDLIYVAASADFDLLSSNTSYGTLALNFNQSGNVDSNGIFYSNSAINGATNLVINKTGTGYFELGNANQTFKGVWNLSAGIMDIQGGGGLGVAQTGVPELTFTGNSTLQFLTGVNGVGSARILAINSGVTGTIDTNGYNVTVGGPIINGTNGSGGSLVKVGSGILTLSGSSNYSGSTTVTAGTLVYSAINNYGGSTNVYGNSTLQLNSNGSIPSTTVLSLGSTSNTGGGTFSMLAGHNFNQGFASVNLYPGSSNISAPSFNNSSLSLSLGTINRSGGATVDFPLPTVGSVTAITANANFTGGHPTILGGYATVNSQSTWAVSAGDGTNPGLVTPLTNFDQTFAATGADVDVTAASNVAAPVATINSLRFNDSSNSYTVTPTGTLTIATGGILETNAVGVNFDTISGGTLTSGNGQDLIIIQGNTNAWLTIASSITDSPAGPIGLTTSGPGIIHLDGSNTFTGPTIIGTGKVQLDNTYALQNSTLTIGTVTFDPNIGNFTIGGIGTNVNLSLQDTGGGGIVLTFGGNNQSTTFNGYFTGIGSLIKVGTGTTYLANGNATFTGGLTINGGMIQFISGGSFGNNSNGPNSTAVVTINAGAGVLYNGAGAATWGTSRGFTLGGGNDTIEIGSLTTASNTSSSALSIGASNYTGGTLAGPATGTATLIKTGLGSLSIYTNSGYNGGTNVSEGTLTAYTANALGVSTLGNGYTGSGPLAIVPTSLFATVNIEAVAPQISSLTNYVNGNASGGTASLVLGFTAVNASTTLSIGADNTSTTFSGNISDRNANYSGAVGTLIKVGTGTLTLSGSNTYVGGTNVTSGSLVFAGATAFPASSNLSIGSLSIVQAANTGSPYALKINSLTNAGSLDLTNNAAVIHTGSTLASVTTQVQQAYNNGLWTGTNASTGTITSSTAGSDTRHLTAVGVIVNDNGSGTALYSSVGPLGTFAGSNPVDGDILVKYTYYGDANLDGKVDGSDYSRIDASFLSEKTGAAVSGWYNGDFNYDGVVNGSDYTLIDNAFNNQSGPLGSAIGSPLAVTTAEVAPAVPEPATLGLLALSTVGLLGSRRRRQ